MAETASAQVSWDATEITRQAFVFSKYWVENEHGTAAEYLKALKRHFGDRWVLQGPQESLEQG